MEFSQSNLQLEYKHFAEAQPINTKLPHTALIA